MQGLDQKAAQRRQGGQHDLLTRLKREDIYRQRVLGTEAGNFIPVDDTRRLSWSLLLIYLIFMYVATQYIWARVEVQTVYTVNAAIRRSIETFSYDTDPVVKMWENIQSVSDVEGWLLNALPLFLTPEVQEYNYPIDQIQFTLRRIRVVDNPNTRFNPLYPLIWVNKNGISSTSETATYDNTSDFGVYNFKDEKTYQLNWTTKPSKRCIKGELLDEWEATNTEEHREVLQTCREWCEHLTVSSDAKPCRCFSLQGHKCKFFFVKRSFLTKSVSTDFLEPPMAPGVEDVVSSANYPSMRRWKFKESGGFQSNPGFVMKMPLPSQEFLLAPSSDRRKPLLQSEMAYDTVRDWISGGLLGRASAALAIDVVTYNPNFQVFTWIQIQFKREASGLVVPDLKLTSLLIPADDRSADSGKFFSDTKGSDVLYIIMVIAYVMWEFVELGQRGVKYFQSGWNLLTILTLGLHICTLGARYVYLSNSKFSIKLRETGLAQDGLTEEFSTQADAFQTFNFFASLNVVFLWFQLVHYLSDCVPKIEVLVNTIYRSLTPVCFLVVIVFDMFFGFVIWSNLMFGKSLLDFSSAATSVFTCIELLFGQVTAFFTLRVYYPSSGGLFFMLYIVVFVFVLQNLSKAVVLTSYDDAFDAWNARREHKKTAVSVRRLEKANHPFAAGIKTVKGRIRKFLQDQAKNFNKEDVKKKHAHKKAQKSRAYNYIFLCVFIVFCIAYMVMTYMQCQINWAFLLTHSVTAALNSYVFERTNPISEQVSNNLRLEDVVTQEDAILYLTQVLPRALFNSSQGMFGVQSAEPNPLKLYHSALPTRFDQLVINNWNIVVGRTEPVRISLRYASLEKAGPGGEISANALVTKDTQKWSKASTISDDATTLGGLVQAKELSQIHNAHTRDFLVEHCAGEYRTAYNALLQGQKNGWACMVSRDYMKAKKMFEDIELKEVINKQIATLVVDFVIYNAYAEAFTYVALWFAFQPSGAVDQGVLTYTVRLDLYSGYQILRLLLEIIIILASCFYLGQSFRNMYRDVKDFTDDPEQSGTDTDGKTDSKFAKGWQKLMQIFQAITMHLVLDPFNLLDLVSSVFTVVTMVLWYLVVFDKMRKFNFPERPLWEPQFIGAGGWTSDAEVIFEFYRCGLKMRWFIRICAINTVLIVLRLLKYLAIFDNVKMMFRTLATGWMDIMYFILMMFVLLMGYVISGQLLFGDISYDFSTLANSVLACFEMFLGTFDYRSLREADKLNYVIYSVSYVIIFRYLLINMFFAIVDKAFVKEERLAEKRNEDKAKAELEEKERMKNQEPDEGQPAQKKGLVGHIGQMVQSFFNRRSQSSIGDEPPISPSGEVGEAPALEAPGSTSSVGQSPHVHGPVPEVEQTASDDEDIDDKQLKDKLEELMDKKDTETSWKSLPSVVRDWAIETACPIMQHVNEMVKDKKNKTEHNQHEPFDLDSSMRMAEDSLQKQLDLKKEEARRSKTSLEEERLGALKQIHQDQEALAWYIMKRESDLKRLEAAKKKKHDRYEEVKQAAKSLISSGDDESIKALEENK